MHGRLPAAGTAGSINDGVLVFQVYDPRIRIETSNGLALEPIQARFARPFLLAGIVEESLRVSLLSHKPRLARTERQGIVSGAPGSRR